MVKEQVLSIAGSDSGGGAGIQADLKTFSSLDTYGTTAITSVTSQNTKGVQKIHDIPPKHIKSQINSILNDFNLSAIKIGMLHNQKIIKAVSDSLKNFDDAIVIDPVMVSETGDLLLNKDSINSLKKELISISTITTPNKHEAEVLSNLDIKNESDILKACKKIKKEGARSVVITGGHFNGNDYFYEKGELKKIEGEIFDDKIHGSGCTYSSAIASYLAKDNPLFKATKKAKKFTESAIRNKHNAGHGTKPVNQLNSLLKNNYRFKVLKNIKKALNMIEPGFSDLIPEVGSNLGMCLPSANSINDVAAVPGRIVRKKDSYEIVGCPEFGGSSHIARLILSIKDFDSQKRAAMNIKYDEEILERIRKEKFSFSCFSREEVPEENTMSFGAEKAIRKHGEVPDAIYDVGGFGKEPMIRVIGESAVKVVKKINLLF